MNVMSFVIGLLLIGAEVLAVIAAIFGKEKDQEFYIPFSIAFGAYLLFEVCMFFFGSPHGEDIYLD